MMDAPVDAVDYADLSADEASTHARRRPLVLWYGLCAVLPAVLVWAYLSFLAAPVYISEFRLAVTDGTVGGADTPTASMAQQAGFVAAEYVTGRQAVEDVRRSLNLAAAFNPDGLDFVNRFWWDDGSIDELARYWRTRAVDAQFDPQAGILSVTVRAFAPQDAQRIARALEQNVERLIGDFGTQQREDMLTAAREELDRAAGQLADTRRALAAFRATERTYAPTQTADAAATLAANLRGSLTTMQAQLAVLTHTLAPTAPAVSVLKAQISATEDELERVRDTLGDPGKGADSSSLPGQLDTYDALQDQRSLETALRDRAATMLQDASLAAVAQRPSVTVFEAAALPQGPLAPRPLRDAAIVLVALSAVWLAGLLIRRALHRPATA